jgi:type II secretory pathway pseudopilin PulG
MKKGQSIIELIFAIVVVGLVLTGVVSLVVKSSGGQTKSTARDRAVALSRIVMEEKVAESKNTPTTFWQKTSVSGGTKTGFSGYTYSVSYTDVTDGGCTSSTCVEVVVTVNWQEATAQSVVFRRFFTR